MSLKFAPASCF